MKVPPAKKVKSVIAVVNPILIVSKVAAVCTIVRDSKKKEFVVSNFWIIFQIIVLIVSVLHLTVIPYGVIYIERISQGGNNANSYGLSSQSFITKMTNIILISATAVAVRIWGLFQMHNILPPLLNNINVVDCSHTTIKKENRDSLWIILFSVMLILISWPYQLYSIVMITTNNWMAFLMFSLNLYNNFSIICCEFQFVSLCWIIKTRIVILNEKLRELGVKIVVDEDEHIVNEISKMRKTYKVLSESCAQLNSLYNFQLLVILSSLYLCVLINLYFAIFGGFKRDSSASELEAPQLAGSINDVIWSFYYFGRLFLVCLAAGHLTEQAKSTKRLICNMMHRSLEIELKQELQKSTGARKISIPIIRILIIFQLWTFLADTTSNDIRFSACGFFKIDTALITSAVSTGATYLVILAQFHAK